MKARRPQPWDATGLVEKAWKRLEPPTRDRLAELLGLKAPTNISKLNTGDLPMTPEYAARIAAVVPGLTIADLGAPSSVVVEVDPTVLDRQEELAKAVKKLSERIEDLAVHIAAIELRLDGMLTRSQPTSRRRRKAS